MSLDLSDAQLTSAREALADPNDPTAWFLLHYGPQSTPTQLQVLGSGPAPALPAWQEHLNVTDEGVIFGYGVVKGKGCVLVYLRSDVGGVRRARAIVHSRAVATLFPDYSAIVQISTPEELTEELLTERLNLNGPTAPSSSSVPTSEVAALASEKVIPVTSQSPSRYPASQDLTTGESDQPRTPPIRPVGLGTPSLPPQHRVSAPSPLECRLPSLPSSTDDRMRKTSLTSRWKNTFNRSSPSTTGDSPSASPGATNSPHDKHLPASPSSPSSSSRFKGNSIGKVFGKRKTSEMGEMPPTSPKIDDFGRDMPGEKDMGQDILYAPPVPPKDSSPHPSNGHSTSMTGTAGHSQPHTPSSPGPVINPVQRSHTLYPDATPPMMHLGPIIPPVPRKSSLRPSLASSPTSTSVDSAPRSAAMSPSPSAKAVLAEASQKSLNYELEIQERFRRDLEKRDGNGIETVKRNHVYVGADNVKDGLEDGDEGDDVAVASVATVRPPLESRSTAFFTPSERPNPIGSPQCVASTSLLTYDTAANGHEDRYHEGRRKEAARNDLENLQIRLEAEQEERNSEPGESLSEAQPTSRDEDGEAEYGASRVDEAYKEEEERHAPQDEEARLAAEWAEQQRVEHERIAAEAAEHQRLQEEEDRARRIAEEQALQRLAEEDRLQHEAEETERIRSEAERSEREREMAEAQRIYQAEQEQEEMKRQRAEEERKRNEEVRSRKEATREGLSKGKREGGVMLRGWLTVQTYKSMTWRRRHFQLLSNEMRLFKNEGDSKPIQTIFLGLSSAISEKYEESQVKDSFKVLSDGPTGEEEFFLFTDSGDDKEVVLEGLRMCLS